MTPALRCMYLAFAVLAALVAGEITDKAAGNLAATMIEVTK